MDKKKKVDNISHHLSYPMFSWTYDKISDEITYYILSPTKHGIWYNIPFLSYSILYPENQTWPKWIMISKIVESITQPIESFLKVLETSNGY